MKRKLLLLAFMGMFIGGSADAERLIRSLQQIPGIAPTKQAKAAPKSFSLFPAKRTSKDTAPIDTMALHRLRTQTQVLQTLAANFGIKDFLNREKALRLAKQYHWPLQQTDANGTTISLQGLDEMGQAHYYVSYNNLEAFDTRTNLLWIGNRSGYNLSGGSINLSGRLGIWDAGRVRSTHLELNGRITHQDNPFSLENHATHVAGTMMASGLNPAAKGMAYAANLKVWDFNNDTPEITTAATGLLVSNHSYGSLCGWRATGRGWEWWGEPTLSETYDWKFGFYTNTCRDWDIITYNAPYYLLVKAAGNNRTDTGPAAGTAYFLSNSNIKSEVVRSRNDGYDIVTTNGNAKNILTVGAANGMPNGYAKPSDVVISAFSSWGPTDDGRIKPDLVGIGVNVLSTGIASDQNYFFASGTSMASPNVTGSLLLLQEHYARLNKGNFMRSASLKGLALHTANEAGNSPGPDYIYGWGLLNTEKAASIISNFGGNHFMQERELTQNQTYTFQIVASGKGPLEATLCWTDPEGIVAPLTPSSVNNRTPKLVNDLDLRISEGQNTYLPWTLDPDNPANAAVPGDNIRDNVEKVFIPNAVPGKTYMVSVLHKGTLQKGPQAYSLIVSGLGGKAYCTSGATSEADSKINEFVFGTIQNASAGNCATYTNATYLTTSVTANQTLPLSLTLGTCGANTDKIGKVFIDWNGDADFDDSNELMATTPLINGTEQYQTTVTVPPGIIPGHSSIIRVVCTETSSASQVAACGNYLQGETQDYRITFGTPANDVGVVEQTYPETNFCANAEAGGVTVLIKNMGQDTQTKVQVTTVIREENGPVVATLNGTYLGSLPPENEASVVLKGTFNAEPGKRYSFTSSTTLAQDADPTNDVYEATRYVSGFVSPPLANATTCGNDPTALITSGGTTAFWYDSPTNGQLLATGSLTYTATKPANNTYYVALNDFKGIVGAVEKAGFSGGSYAQHTAAVTFTTQVPLMLERARLYVGNSGQIKFTVENLQGYPISSTVLNVEATRTPEATGEAADDASDQGADYYLNLPIPAAGDYRLTVSYFNGATLYRSNAGVSGYPFTIPKIVSITGTTAGNSTYNYLYDLRVKSVGCPSPRIPVIADAAPEAVATISSAPSISFCQGDSWVLKANVAADLTYQWNKNGLGLEGATTDSLQVTEPGNYTVTVTNDNGCSKTSTAIAVTVDPNTSIAVNVIADSSPEVCPGNAINILLTAVTDLSPSLLRFQWQKNKVDILDATNAQYQATQPGSYTVRIGRLPCSVSISDSLVISHAAVDLVVANATICGGTGAAELTAQSNVGTVAWYDAPTGGDLQAIGNHFVTPVLNATKSYYATVNDFSAIVPSPTVSSGGEYSSETSSKLYFDAKVPFMLEKATLNINAPGSGLTTVTVTITDKNRSDNVIASTVLQVSSGVAEYPLDLFIPAAGDDYGIQLSEFVGTTQAYIITTPGAIHYPYEIAGLVTIKGNNQMTPANYYGYLYQWKVKSTGCATSSRSEVKVKVLASTPPQAILSSENQVICRGDLASLPLTLQGVAPWSITYTNGQIPITIDSIPSSPYSLLVSQAATYSLVSVNDGQSCVNGQVSGSATVSINELPTEYPSIIVSGPTTFCLGESVQLTASIGFEHYLWSTGETSNSIVIQQSGTYTVSGSIANCYGPLSDSIKVLVQPIIDQPIITANGPLSFCVGDSVTLSAPKAYDQYLWSTGESTPSITVKESGSFKVAVANVGCPGPVSELVIIEVNHNLPPKPEVATLGLRLMSSSTTGNQWFQDGHLIAGATQQAYAVSATGKYMVRVNQAGCEITSDEVSIIVTDLDNTSANGIELYPNPAQQRFVVKYPISQASSRVTATVYNAMGMELFAQELRAEQQVWHGIFEVAHLSQGVYFIKIMENGKVAVRTWVKE
ncbi:MAG: S8 family serine peptidase [Bacteroidota bacterium]